MSGLRAADGRALKPQLEMVRGNAVVPAVSGIAAGYLLRQVALEDRQSYTQTFATAFDDSSPFGDLIKHTLTGGFFVVEHLPTGTFIAASTVAVCQKSQHPNGHSLQQASSHSDQHGTGAGWATVAAGTQVLADHAPGYSYLSTNDFRIPAINI